MSFLWSAFSGWSAALLLGAGIGIPYAARNLQWSNLLPHYYLGFLIPLAAALHASLAMSLLRVQRSDMWGLLLATAALVFMVGQAGLGMAVRAARGHVRHETRRAHLRTMVIILAIVSAHVVLNRG